MSDLVRQPIYRKARKQHQCIACYHHIIVGENYIEQTGFWEGEAFRNRYHGECWDSLCDSDEREFMPGSFEPPERLQKETL